MKNQFGGINDMPMGYTRTAEGGQVYHLWYRILRRCYDAKQLRRTRGKSYANVKVCDRWFSLRNFAEDIKKLSNYDEWLCNPTIQLDKDINSNGEHIYSPETCTFVSRTENMREMNNRCQTVKIAQEASKAKYQLKKGNEVQIFNTEKGACEFLGVKQCSVAGAWRDRGTCKGWKVTRLGNSADMRGGKNEEERHRLALYL